MPTLGTLSFVDETRDTIAIYETVTEGSTRRPSVFSERVTPSVNLPNHDSPGKHSRSRSVTGLISPLVSPLASSSKSHQLGSDVSSFFEFNPRYEGLSPAVSFPTFGDFASPGNSSTITGHIQSPRPLIDSESSSSFQPSRDRRVTFSGSIGTPSFSYLEVKSGLLKSPTEARLLQHFVENLSSSFDLTDSLCHFRFVIPQLAVHDPILLNAILAASARHLSRTTNADPYIADKYHQECIQHLIPMLSDENAVLNENLLAATVILRFLEEIDVPISGQTHPESSGHLIGTHIFITAQESSAMLGGLRLAAFWVGLRQEIYVAFVNQRSIIPPLQHCNVDRSFNAADDGTWANRIIVHCAETIRYCFGIHEHERNHARFLELLQYCEEWAKYTPSSFTPIFYKDPDAENVFPEIMYLSDAVVTGIQHYHLTLILLTALDPRIPSLGPRRMAALKNMDSGIRHHVRVLCGLALSNSSTPPHFVTASMAVAMAGDKFTDLREQQACMAILERCEVDHGWLTPTAQKDLKEAWGWVSPE